MSKTIVKNKSHSHDGHNHKGDDHKGHKHDGHNHKGHDHGGIGGGHSHAPANYDLRFALGIILNLIFIAVEIYYGKKAASSALIADAIHNLADVMGLVISWLGMFLGKFKQSPKFTFALKNATILASFINAIFLIAGVVFIFLEAYKGLSEARQMLPWDIIIVASIGIVINAGTAFLFLSGAKDDINIKGAFLHMMSDALVSLGVVIVGVILIFFPSFSMLDPIVSFTIGILILLSGYGLLKESSKLLFLGVPSNVNSEKVKEVILAEEGVIDMHDLHIWALSTTENSISVHLVTNDQYSNQKLIRKLKQEFKLHHFAIQIENNFEECESKC